MYTRFNKIKTTGTNSKEKWECDETGTFIVIVFGADDVLCEITFPYLVVKNQGFQIIMPLSHMSSSLVLVGLF